MDPHSFLADPDSAVFLNAVPDPAAFLMRIQIQLQICEKLLLKRFYKVKNTRKIAQKYKNQWSRSKFTVKTKNCNEMPIVTNFLKFFSLNFSLLDPC